MRKNEIMKRTIGGNGQVYIPKLLCKQAELAETNKAFIMCAGRTILIQKQEYPEQETTEKVLILNALYGLPQNHLYDITVTLIQHLTDNLMKGGE